MAAETAISWCDATFNPTIGCTKVSAGCTNCFAERDFDRRRHVAKWGPEGTRIRTSPEYWRNLRLWNDRKRAGVCIACNGDPIRKTRRGNVQTCGTCRGEGRLDHRPRIFVASLSDWAEDWTKEVRDSKGRILLISQSGDAYDTFDDTIEPWKEPSTGEAWRMLTYSDIVRELLSAVDRCQELDFLFLTKRPERVAGLIEGGPKPPDFDRGYGWRRHNLWLGTSIEDQKSAEARLPIIRGWDKYALRTFVSAEPLIGHIDLMSEGIGCQYCECMEDGIPCPETGAVDCRRCDSTGFDCDRSFIDWMIVGGESGANFRPMEASWVKSLRAQCDDLEIAFHFKQWAATIPGGNGNLLDGKVYAEFP